MYLRSQEKTIQIKSPSEHQPVVIRFYFFFFSSNGDAVG